MLRARSLSLSQIDNKFFKNTRIVIINSGDHKDWSGTQVHFWSYWNVPCLPHTHTGTLTFLKSHWAEEIWFVQLFNMCMVHSEFSLKTMAHTCRETQKPWSKIPCLLFTERQEGLSVLQHSLNVSHLVVVSPQYPAQVTAWLLSPDQAWHAYHFLPTSPRPPWSITYVPMFTGVIKAQEVPISLCLTMSFLGCLDHTTFLKRSAHYSSNVKHSRIPQIRVGSAALGTHH